jgi:uncharacterized membrane protein
MKAPELFTAQDRERISQAVKSAERLTSGEIRVFIDDHCGEDPLEKAAFLFRKLNMEATAERNGVLVYVAMQDHRLAIYGDTGIHEKLPAAFWQDVVQGMGDRFRDGRYVDGLAWAVSEVGRRLAAHFPAGNHNPNELSDEITFGGGDS